jgi:hypothetical protein
VKVFVVVLIIFVVLLDAHALFDNRRQAGDDAHEAAMAAAVVYSRTENDTQAEREAKRVLDDKDAQMVAFKTEHLADNTYYTVTATREARTYLFHYLAGFPWVGAWAVRLAHPDVSSNNFAY